MNFTANLVHDHTRARSIPDGPLYGWPSFPSPPLYFHFIARANCYYLQLSTNTLISFRARTSAFGESQRDEE